ncbi:hypothetical protein S40288_10935 [Stachybotrys chartarum IBT 40288]|nr:hypothetical protein S40288_10935 [Stachybotrys chartarum IBT 40288]
MQSESQFAMGNPQSPFPTAYCCLITVPGCNPAAWDAAKSTGGVADAHHHAQPTNASQPDPPHTFGAHSQYAMPGGTYTVHGHACVHGCDGNGRQ